MIVIKDDIREMANLLRSGHTMLNLACPVCNNPIFRNKQGEMFCPTCKRKVLIENNEISKVNEDNKLINSNYEKEESDINNREVKVIVSLKEVILEKIEWTAQKLKSETQIDLIERYVKILLNFYNLLEKFTNLDG